MNVIDELRLNSKSLLIAVKNDQRFFISIIHYVERLNDLLNSNMDYHNLDELKLLKDKIEEFYKRWRPTKSQGVLYIPPRQTSDTDSTVKDIGKLVEQILELNLIDYKTLVSTINNSTMEDRNDKENCIFIGHGHSNIWAILNLHLENDLKLKTKAFESDSTTGKSIIQILEEILNMATFAILILTADDETSNGQKRARQNVIHELGLFQGKLGFTKAIILKQEGTEEFTNIAGLQYISFTQNNIHHTFYELDRVLKREGILK